MLYLGSEKQKNYLAQLIFGKFYQETYHGKAWLWEIHRILKRPSSYYSMVVIEGSDWHRKLYQRSGDFYVPCWVRGEFEIPFNMKTREIQPDLGRIKRAKLKYVVTTSVDLYNDFYYKMYKPYLLMRYGKTALEIDYEKNLKRLQSGVCDLLLVIKGDRYIAGNLIKYDNDGTECFVNGVLNGDESYLRYGALAATYYFTCQYLERRGYKCVNVGGSRAFLADGLINYKKKWGLKLTGHKGGGFILKVVSLCPAVREFFLRNPFIYLDGNEFRIALFCDDARSPLAETLRKVDWYSAIEGISGWTVYRFGDGQDGQAVQVCCRFTRNGAKREGVSSERTRIASAVWRKVA
jgi:hypothetical protein